MAYANAHVKVTIFGQAFGGAEEWSTGFRMGGEDSGGGNFGIGAGWLDALLPLWQTFFTAVATNISDDFNTVGIKAAIILPDGKTDLANVATAAYGTPIVGGKATNAFPPQVALVAQLAASSPQGLGAKGRMYLPGVCAVLGANGTLDAGTTLGIANGLRTFLDGAETATNSPGYVINASKGRPGVPFTAPVNRRVTKVRVGSVYDTQRRRRNALTEVYSEAALAA
jgi:hypothetical protein